jgi:hypothetical protein
MGQYRNKSGEHAPQGGSFVPTEFPFGFSSGAVHVTFATKNFSDFDSDKKFMYLPHFFNRLFPSILEMVRIIHEIILEKLCKFSLASFIIIK